MEMPRRVELTRIVQRVAKFDVKQALQTVVLQGKKFGKSVYVFSADPEANKVVHVNYVDSVLKAKGLDARAWANNAASIIGGKVCVSTWALTNFCVYFIYSGWWQGRWSAGCWNRHLQGR
jgi:hypothetical protein